MKFHNAKFSSRALKVLTDMDKSSENDLDSLTIGTNLNERILNDNWDLTTRCSPTRLLSQLAILKDYCCHSNQKEISQCQSLTDIAAIVKITPAFSNKLSNELGYSFYYIPFCFFDPKILDLWLDLVIVLAYGQSGPTNMSHLCPGRCIGCIQYSLGQLLAKNNDLAHKVT